MYSKITFICLCLFLINSYAGAIPFPEEDVWIPDPYLRGAIYETLDISGRLLHIEDMQHLTHLVAEHDIERLNGLEHAINLEFLHIGRTKVSDLTPLAGLENLRVLKLFSNQITDISPLTGLINLEELQLQANQISDLTPLVGLIGLRHLALENNVITDISPLVGLIGLRHLALENNVITDVKPLVNLRNLETLSIFLNPFPRGNQFTGIEAQHLKALIDASICDIPRPSYTTPVTQRLNTRDYPSAFLSHKRDHDLEQYSDTFDQFVLYDLSFMFEPFYPLSSADTLKSPFGSEVRRIDDNLSQVHRDAIRENPNMIFIVEIAYFDGRFLNLGDDSPYWFRNADGSIAIREWNVDAFGNVQVERLVNFTHPDVIEMIIQRCVAIAKCGLYDGIWLDRWHPDFGGELSHLVTPEDERNARIEILQGIRANVRDDFLIMINSRQEFPHFAPYINGVFIEAHEPKPQYTHEDLYHFENLIKWYESNLRKPRFTLLWGQVAHKPPRSQRVMRLFTTLSLTHSDGFVSVSSEPHPLRTYYYDFWDVDLGYPIGVKGQAYEGIDGLFIREYTNGWAVYNRSGKAQTVRLPQDATSVSSEVTGPQHVLDDLDGEIYLKSVATADVNADGIVNVLDLVLVANGFGSGAPDLNADGVVNVLDLVIVANAF